MKVQYVFNLLFINAILVILPAYSASVYLQVEGLNGELLRNVRTRLATINKYDNVTVDTYFQNQIDKTVREGLRVFGYYSPTINFNFKPMNSGRNNVLIVHINPGKPIKICNVNVILRGEATQDNDYQQWIKNNKPQLGSTLNHSYYDRFKNGFYSLALRKGYFDAKFCTSQLGILSSHYQAYYEIDFDSGKRYRFEKICFHGAQIRKDYLQNLAKINEGDPYSTEYLAELNHRLIATNWFSSVVTSPIFSASKQSKKLLLNTTVVPCTRNIIKTGVGYSTDVGPRIKVTWNKPCINSRGHSIQNSINLSLSEQMVDFNYKIPMPKDPLEQYYFLRGRFKREDVNDTQSDSAMLTVARYWDLANSWQRSIHLQWSLEHFIQNKVSDKTMLMLIYPGISVNRTQQRGGLMPTWGTSQRYSVDVSNTIWNSNINFIILQVQNIWIFTLTEKHRFIARENLGWIKTNNFKYIPLSLRFFAGGDRSIRGYKYKSLYLQEDDSKLIGASKLVTCSLEYQYNVTKKWWGVMFIDCGEAVDNVRQSNFKTGSGIGIRWQSIVGPIKLDVAMPISNNNKYSIRFYVGLGPEL